MKHLRAPLIILAAIVMTGCVNSAKLVSGSGFMCPEVYKPICAKVAVECIKAPCPKIERTFSNICFLKQNPRASFFS